MNLLRVAAATTLTLLLTGAGAATALSSTSASAAGSLRAAPSASVTPVAPVAPVAARRQPRVPVTPGSRVVGPIEHSADHRHESWLELPDGEGPRSAVQHFRVVSYDVSHDQTTSLATTRRAASCCASPHLELTGLFATLRDGRVLFPGTAGTLVWTPGRAGTVELPETGGTTLGFWADGVVLDRPGSTPERAAIGADGSLHATN